MCAWTRTNRLSAITAAAILLGGLATWWLATSEHQNTPASDEYQFVHPVTGRIESTVTAQGKLEPREYVVVGAQVSGQLKKIHVEIGSAVRAGELLAEIDPRVYQARVKADEARLRNLRAQLAEQLTQVTLAEQIYRRQSRLIETRAVSQEVLQVSETTLKAAQAKAESIRAQIDEAQSTLDGDRTNLSYTRIYAPIDGTVVSLTAREGQTLNANQQAPSILQISNLDRMTVRVQVAEADIMRLAPGMPVYFSTLGSLDRRWRGSLRQILPSPEIVNDVVLYHALVDVSNQDRQLMSSMSAQVFFVLGEADLVPLLPASALGARQPAEDDASGAAYCVKVRHGATVDERIVHIGLRNRTHAELRAGLAEGEEIAVPKLHAAPASRMASRPVQGMPRL